MGLHSLSHELLAKVLTSHCKACAQGAKLCKDIHRLIIAYDLSASIGLLRDGVIVPREIEILSPQLCTGGNTLYVTSPHCTFCELDLLTPKAQCTEWNGTETSVSCMTAWKDMVITEHNNPDTCLLVWNTLTGDCNHVLWGHDDSISCVALWRQYLFSGSHDNTVKVWKMEAAGSWPCLHTIAEHTLAVRAMLGWEGQVITGSEEGEIAVSDIATGQCKAASFPRHCFDTQ